MGTLELKNVKSCKFKGWRQGLAMAKNKSNKMRKKYLKDQIQRKI